MILIKNLHEIEGIRKSCQIVGDLLRLLKSYIKPGVTTKELDVLAEDFIRSNNAIPAFKGYSQSGSFDFPASICTSPDYYVVHGIPNNKPLDEGQILSVDVGVNLNNYFGDAAFTYPIGEITEDKKKLLKVTEESLYIGISNAIVGNRINDISASVESHVLGNGFSVVKDLCGHGVGKKLHEDPEIPNYSVKKITPRLKAGMTLAIEPMVNAGDYRVKMLDDGWSVVTTDGMPSAHFEHTILITDGTPEVLTK